MVEIIDNTGDIQDKPYEQGDFLEIEGEVHQVIRLDSEIAKYQPSAPLGLYTVNLQTGFVSLICNHNPPTNSDLDIRNINVREIELT